MSCRSTRRAACFFLACLLVAGCGGGGGGGSGGKAASANEPKNAREKQLQEAKASGEVDGTGEASWGKWRYTGERNDCFYSVGRKCFKTEVAACKTLKCKKDEKCVSKGAGPATVACKK